MNKTNEDTISEQEKFLSTGQPGRMSGLALKKMEKYNNEKSPENKEASRKALTRSLKTDAIRNARKARKV